MGRILFGGKTAARSTFNLGILVWRAEMGKKKTIDLSQISSD
jgi:hypothetical protein